MVKNSWAVRRFVMQEKKPLQQYLEIRDMIDFGLLISEIPRNFVINNWCKKKK